MGTVRIILAITIVVAHSRSFFGLTFTGGLVAVELFFMISGFYMTMILENKYIGKGSYKLFLSNRFLRLYPMYWTVLLASILGSVFSFIMFGRWLRLESYIKYFDIMSLKSLFIQIFANLALFGQDIIMFLGMSKETGEIFFTSNFRETDPLFYDFLLVPQAWSLGIEVMFYVIAPFIVRKSNLFVTSIIFCSLCIRGVTYSVGYVNDPWIYRFFPSEIALFLLGTISYRIYRSLPEIKILNKTNKGIIIAIFFSALFAYQLLPRMSIWYEHIINWSFYLFACLAIPCLFEASKSSKIDSRIGELSYPIYISHFFIVVFMSPFIMSFGLLEYKGEIMVLLTLIASYALVRVIADPIEKIRQSRVGKIHHA